MEQAMKNTCHRYPLDVPSSFFTDYRGKARTRLLFACNHAGEPCWKIHTSDVRHRDESLAGYYLHRRAKMKVMIAVLLSSALVYSAAAQDASSQIKTETLLQSTASWDGTPYKAYPAGQPKITVLKITIAANTVMKWHSHPFPNAGYVLSGELTVEKKDGMKRHF